MVPAVLMRLMFPAIGVLAIYLLMRGHNLPGGGFVAGLTMAVAIILQYMAGGTRWVEDRLNFRPVRLMGVGLLLAAATGAGAWVFGYPFLTSHTAHVDLPLHRRTAPAECASSFDLGVFSLVVGATALILIALAHQSTRSQRAPRENMNELIVALGHRRADRLRRLAAAAAAHLSGHASACRCSRTPSTCSSWRWVVCA